MVTARESWTRPDFLIESSSAVLAPEMCYAAKMAERGILVTYMQVKRKHQARGPDITSNKLALAEPSHTNDPSKSHSKSPRTSSPPHQKNHNLQKRNLEICLMVSQG